jgi:hypothetical protein
VKEPGGELHRSGEVNNTATVLSTGLPQGRFPDCG